MPEASGKQALTRMAWILVAGFGLLGTCVALLQPPFHLPDERRHWLTAHVRAERLLGGERVCSYDVALERHFRLKIHFDPDRKVPAGTFEAVDALEPDCQETIRYRFSNAFSYPGVLLVRWLTPEPQSGRGALLRFRAARIVTGLLLLALLARAVVLAGRSGGLPPFGLLLLLALPLSPLFAQQSFGVTPDAVVNGAALSLAFWLALGTTARRGDLAVCCGLSLVAALTKPVLIPVLPAAVLLGLWLEERDRDGGAPLIASVLRGVRRRPVFVAAMLGIVLAGLVYAAANPGTEYRSGGAIDGAAQLEFVKQNPGTTARVVGGGVLAVLLRPTSLIGPLGYLDTPMTLATVLAFAAILALALLGEWSAGPPGRPVGGRTGTALLLLLALSLAISVAAMAFNMYLMATGVGGERLYGLQPRYLFPHLLIALGAGCGLLRSRTPAAGRPALQTGLAIALTATTLALALSAALDIAHRYYST